MPRMYAIDRVGQGRLWALPAPQGGERLPDQLDALRRAGVNTLVSLLDDREADALGLADEVAEAGRQGIRFVRLPTSDFGAPDAADALAVARGVRDDLLAGRGVAIHCRAGIGRSSVRSWLRWHRTWLAAPMRSTLPPAIGRPATTSPAWSPRSPRTS